MKPLFEKYSSCCKLDIQRRSKGGADEILLRPNTTLGILLTDLVTVADGTTLWCGG